MAVAAMAAAPMLADEKTIYFDSYSNNEEMGSVSEGVVTVEFSKGSNTNANSVPIYTDSGECVRLYAKNTLTVSVSGNYDLEKVEFTFSGSNKFNSGSTASTGTFADNVWTATEATKTVTLTNGGTKGHARIQNIKITYADNSKPALLPADVKFPEAAMTAIIGLPFAGQSATTASDGTLLYASDDMSVAKVNAATGAVTLVAPGTTTITAMVGETDKYQAGLASYTLTVVKGYESIAEFNTLTDGEKGLLVFPMTVAYQNGSYLYAYDAAGDFALIFGSNQPSYKVGDVIPAGWEAAQKIYNGLCEMIPQATLPEADGHNDFTPETVSELSEALLNHIVVLEGVEFDKATVNTTTGSSASRTFTGVMGGSEVTFYSTFSGIESVEAGKYDVLAAVSTFKGNIQVYPISYTEVVESGIDAIDAAAEDAVYYNLQGARVANPERGLYIRVSAGKAQKVLVK